MVEERNAPKLTDEQLGLVGLVIEDYENAGFADAVAGMEERAQVHGKMAAAVTAALARLMTLEAAALRASAPPPADLASLRLMLKNAERACDSDNLDAATDYVREALRLLPAPPVPPAAPAPDSAGQWNHA